MAQMRRDVFVRILSTNHCGSENRIGWGQAGSNDQRGQEVKAWNKRINESGADEPALAMVSHAPATR